MTLRPEDDEDMWHVYNLISEGDEVRALAVRRVQTVSSTGSSDSFRVRVNLTLSVTKVSSAIAGLQELVLSADHLLTRCELLHYVPRREERTYRLSADIRQGG